MASIKRRSAADGARYDVRYRDPSGKVRTKTFRRRADADKFAATTEADKLRGAWIDPDAGRALFRGYADEWVAQRTTSNGRDDERPLVPLPRPRQGDEQVNELDQLRTEVAELRALVTMWANASP